MPLNTLQRRAALSAGNIPMANPSPKVVQTISDALAIGLSRMSIPMSLHSNLSTYSARRKRRLDLREYLNIADSASIYEREVSHASRAEGYFWGKYHNVYIED